MKRSKEELLQLASNILADRNDDEAIQFLEDIADSMSDEDVVDWEAKYNALDNEWRERYKKRFNEGDINEEKEVEDEEKELEDEEKEIEVEDLFEEKESEKNGK